VTTKDKTGDQLMASIRKTKSEGATPGKDPVGAPTATPTAPKAAVPKAKPATAKPARVAKKKVAAKPKPSQTGRDQASTAGYQSRGRVWPD
jgi:hypothetical protein